VTFKSHEWTALGYLKSYLVDTLRLLVWDGLEIVALHDEVLVEKRIILFLNVPNLLVDVHSIRQIVAGLQGILTSGPAERKAVEETPFTDLPADYDGTWASRAISGYLVWTP